MFWLGSICEGNDFKSMRVETVKSAPIAPAHTVAISCHMTLMGSGSSIDNVPCKRTCSGFEPSHVCLDVINGKHI